MPPGPNRRLLTVKVRHEIAFLIRGIAGSPRVPVVEPRPVQTS